MLGLHQRKNLVEDANEELDALNSFDPENTVIIDKRYSGELKEFIKDSSATINLDLKSYKPNHLTYNLTNVVSDQLAVFSEIYYEKGWNAYIDNKIVPHFRANYVLRSMMVPAGKLIRLSLSLSPLCISLGKQ